MLYQARGMRSSSRTNFVRRVSIWAMAASLCAARPRRGPRAYRCGRRARNRRKSPASPAPRSGVKITIPLPLPESLALPPACDPVSFPHGRAVEPALADPAGHAFWLGLTTAGLGFGFGLTTVGFG